MANNTTFGGPTFNSDVGFDIGFSDDKKAFTATFSGLVVSLDATGSAPIVTRVFSFALPLSGAECSGPGSLNRFSASLSGVCRG